MFHLVLTSILHMHRHQQGQKKMESHQVGVEVETQLVLEEVHLGVEGVHLQKEEEELEPRVAEEYSPK